VLSKGRTKLKKEELQAQEWRRNMRTHKMMKGKVESFAIPIVVKVVPLVV
jgi:hypothetical protein